MIPVLVGQGDSSLEAGPVLDFVLVGDWIKGAWAQGKESGTLPWTNSLVAVSTPVTNPQHYRAHSNLSTEHH